MSKVKTYAVNCNDAWLNTDGDDISESYVKYADYMVLATKLELAERACAARAAENVGMIARKPVAYSYRYAGCETCEGFQDWRWELSKEKPPEWMLETGKVTNLVELFELHETKATDAFLAEVMAHGVEMFADHLLCPDLDGTIRDFAAQLRKGEWQK